MSLDYPSPRSISLLGKGNESTLLGFQGGTGKRRSKCPCRRRTRVEEKISGVKKRGRTLLFALNSIAQEERDLGIPILKCACAKCVVG